MFLNYMYPQPIYYFLNCNLWQTTPVPFAWTVLSLKSSKFLLDYQNQFSYFSKLYTTKCTENNHFSLIKKG